MGGMGRTRGFTLIELLVVIAIIGMLSSVVLASLNEARAKSRDSSRLQAIRQVQLALELYYDQNGEYPTACGGLTLAWRGAGSNFGSCTTDYIEGLAPDFIPVLPIDPVNVTYGYIYIV
jgi:prepilin-type N-terminal cleavage/methylation domain-containing protein